MSTDAEPPRILTRRQAIGATAAAAVALHATADAAPAARRKRRRRRRRRPRPAALPPLGSGGRPMTLPEVAALARREGKGEPIAIIDLAAVDQNCDVLLRWSRETGIAWRPAYKTLQAPDLMAYVAAKLDRPRVMIHHLRNLSHVLPKLPRGTDFLMGYPPTLGELETYLATRPPRGERPHTLRINVDNLGLLQALDRLTRTTKRELPIEVVLELEDFRGGLVPGPELGEALKIVRAAKDRIRVGALLCYDTLSVAEGNDLNRRTWADYAQDRLSAAVRQIEAEAADVIDVRTLIRNGPGSANYRNWAPGSATEFSAGSAVLYANYLDSGFDTDGLAKALYLCAPVLRLPSHTVGGLTAAPAGQQFTFIKAGGWPTGNGAVLSKIVHPPGMQESSVAGLVGYGRGANSSGMLLAPRGTVALGDYVVETCQQVMEGQNYFGALHAVREGTVRRVWPTLPRWSGARAELSG